MAAIENVPNGRVVSIDRASAQFYRVKSKLVRTFSVLNIGLGLVCCVLMTAILVPFIGGVGFVLSGKSVDSFGYGLWAGIVYVITGILGHSASYRPTKSMLITLIVLGAISSLTSLTAAVLSEFASGQVFRNRPCRVYHADYWDYTFNRFNCNVWQGLDYALMGFTILAGVNNIVVTSLASMAVCGSERRVQSTTYYFVSPDGRSLSDVDDPSLQPVMLLDSPLAFEQVQQLLRQQLPQQQP